MAFYVFLPISSFLFFFSFSYILISLSLCLSLFLSIIRLYLCFYSAFLLYLSARSCYFFSLTLFMLSLFILADSFNSGDTSKLHVEGRGGSPRKACLTQLNLIHSLVVKLTKVYLSSLMFFFTLSKNGCFSSSLIRILRCSFNTHCFEFFSYVFAYL